MSKKRKAQGVLKKAIGATVPLSLFMSAMGSYCGSVYYGTGVLRGIRVWYFVTLPPLSFPGSFCITISPEPDPWSKRSTRFDFGEGDHIKISNEELTLFTLKALL